MSQRHYLTAAAILSLAGADAEMLRRCRQLLEEGAELVSNAVSILNAAERFAAHRLDDRFADFWSDLRLLLAEILPWQPAHFEQALELQRLHRLEFFVACEFSAIRAAGCHGAPGLGRTGQLICALPEIAAGGKDLTP